MEMTKQDIHVHGWFSTETSYVGTGTDVTAWVESALDNQLINALGPIDVNDDSKYDLTVVRLPATFFSDWPKEDVPNDLARIGADVLAPMELDSYELATYIRFNRPALRDRLSLCACQEIRHDGRACHCDATVETAGSSCSDCLDEQHNFRGRS